ncbi:hypothetical protein A2U01_0064208, partial [Trifolium medium]|nr:hypothetical protein [Trifolium medium]
MAEASEKYKLVDMITDPELDWVGLEPQGIASTITPTAGGTYTHVEEGDAENWEVYCPAEGKCVCAFKELGFRLPFSDLAAG